MNFPLSLSPCSVIITFPPHDRKDRNNLAEIYSSLGFRHNSFAPEQVKHWLNGMLRVSRCHGAQPRVADAAHRASRLRGDRRKVCETRSMCDLPARILSESD